METAWTMTRFTAGVERVWPLSDQAGVIGGLKPTVDFLMALLAFLGANVLRTRNIRQHDDGSVDSLARHHCHEQHWNSANRHQRPPPGRGAFSQFIEGIHHELGSRGTRTFQ